MNQLGLSKSPADGDLEKSLLFEVSIPELFRQNAFRLLELPISANQREISRRAQMLRMAAEKGLSKAATSNVFPVTPPPDAQDFKESERKLSDVSRRLIDELFWFWPLEETGSDEAFDALAARAYSKAVSIWNDLLKKPNAEIGIHNLAILYHLSALDLEHRSSTASLTPKEQQLRQSYWSAAMQYWHLAIQHEGTWNFIAKRIRAINDPSLKADSARRIREFLPSALLKINSGLAVDALVKGDSEEVRKQIGFIRQSGFEESHSEAAAKIYNQRLRSEVKNLCAQATSEAEQDPWVAGKTTDHLLNRGAFLLWGIDNLLPNQSATRDELHDEITKAALDCISKFGDTTHKWPQILKLFERVLVLTTNPTLRENIESWAEVIRDVQPTQAYWCGEGYYELPDEIYIELEKARKSAESDDVAGAITTLLDLYRRPNLPTVPKALVCGPLVWCLNVQAADRIKYLDALCASFTDESMEASARTVEVIERRKAEIANGLRESAYEFLTANYLQSNNNSVVQNLTDLRRMLKELGLKMPGLALSLMYFRLADASILQQALRDSDAEVRSAARKLLNGIEPDYFPPYRPSRSFHQILVGLKKSARYWVTGLGILWVVLLLWISQNSQTQNSQPGKPSSYGTAAQTPPPTISKPSELRSLESEIDELQKKITGYDTELTSMESQLDEFRNQIQEFAAIINSCNRARRIGDEVDEDYCADILKTHNQIVAKHNSLLKKHRADQSARNQVVKQVNAKVDRYNSLLHN